MSSKRWRPRPHAKSEVCKKLYLVRSRQGGPWSASGGKHLGPSRRFRQPEKRRCARCPSAGATVLLIRDIAPINEYRLGQRLGPCDLAADGRADSASRRFSGHSGGLTPNGARPETLPAVSRGLS